MLQNYDGSSSYGDPAMAGRWAGAQHAHNSPIHSPNADTSSQTGYNIANDKTPLICRLTQEFGGLTLRRKQVSPGRVEVAGGRKMPRADSEELGFELRRRPSSAWTSGKKNQYETVTKEIPP